MSTIGDDGICRTTKTNWDGSTLSFVGGHGGGQYTGQGTFPTLEIPVRGVSNMPNVVVSESGGTSLGGTLPPTHVGPPNQPPGPPAPPPPISSGGITTPGSTTWEVTKDVARNFGEGLYDLSAGAANAGKEFAYYFRDIGAVGLDAALLLAGGDGYGFEEWSSIGRSNQPGDPDFAANALLNSGRAGMAAGTLGASEGVLSIAQYVGDGDGRMLRRSMGGMAVTNLTAAGVTAAMSGGPSRFVGTRAAAIEGATAEGSAVRTALGAAEDVVKGAGTVADDVASAGKEAARYKKYWESTAPEQSKPYDVMRRYTEDGSIKQVTTYDKYGNRATQFDLIDSRGRAPHRHDFSYPPNSRPYGLRSPEHVSLDIVPEH